MNNRIKSEKTSLLHYLMQTITECTMLILYVIIGTFQLHGKPSEKSIEASSTLTLTYPQNEEMTYIKWVDFNVSYEALNKAYEYDIDTYGKEVHLNWIEMLAYTAAKYGGTFHTDALHTMDKLTDELLAQDTTIEELTENMKYYSYYLEAYEAVLAEYVGVYMIQVDGQWTELYGLKCYSPIAYSFPYSDYDDFGSSRSYGYKREHLGHDMMGQIGTPIIAIESGVVEKTGWNQYGGWRIGIRSFDGLRYYYYAHLRQNRPYAEGLEEGNIVTAGDVIGCMGHTGYSTEENVNNIKVTHLHWGLQLIFDESQEEGNGEIWIDCYALTRFLYKNRSVVSRNDETKEWTRTTIIQDSSILEHNAQGKLEFPQNVIKK